MLRRTPQDEWLIRPCLGTLREYAMFMLKDMRPPPRNMSVCFAGWPFQCACVNQSGCSHVVVPCFEGGDFWKTQGKWDGKMVPLEDKLQAYTIWAAESSGGGN